jgi:hypothetical protein
VVVAAGSERPGMRFLEFFAADIRNPHTPHRRPQMNFWPGGRLGGPCVPSIGPVQPVQVTTGSRPGPRPLEAPSAKHEYGSRLRARGKRT